MQKNRVAKDHERSKTREESGKVILKKNAERAVFCTQKKKENFSLQTVWFDTFWIAF